MSKCLSLLTYIELRSVYGILNTGTIKTEMRVDEAIIAAVFKRDVIWNPSNIQHKNGFVLKKIWEDIAQEVQRDVKTVKTRWKNIRSYYFREWKRIEKSNSGDGTKASTRSSWNLFNQLHFLSNTICISESDFLEQPESPSLSEAEESTTKEDIPYTSAANFASVVINSSPFPPRKKIRNNIKSEGNEHLLELERRNVESLGEKSEKECNDDRLFFESLLPYMREIPLIPKLKLRNSIQELILKELIKEDN